MRDIGDGMLLSSACELREEEDRGLRNHSFKSFLAFDNRLVEIFGINDVTTFGLNWLPGDGDIAEVDIVKPLFVFVSFLSSATGLVLLLEVFFFGINTFVVSYSSPTYSSSAGHQFFG